MGAVDLKASLICKPLEVLLPEPGARRVASISVACYVDFLCIRKRLGTDMEPPLEYALACKVGSVVVRPKIDKSGVVIDHIYPIWDYPTKFLDLEVMAEDSPGILLLSVFAPVVSETAQVIQTEAREEYGDIRRRLELVPLQPYSPDLNPIEQVWRKTRKEVTHNRYFSNISELTKSLDDYFEGYNVATFSSMDEIF